MGLCSCRLNCLSFKNILGIVDTTAAPAVNQFFNHIRYYCHCFRLIFSLFYLALLLPGGTFTKKTLGGAARILNHSRVVLTIYDMVFGLLLFEVGRGRVI